MHRALLMMGSVLASGIAAPALAQSLPPDAPPIRSPQDPNGVDLSTGKIFVDAPTIAIGVPDQGGIVFAREVSGSSYWKHNHYIFLAVNFNQAEVYIGPVRRSFTLSSGTFVSNQGDGSTLTAGSGTYTYTARDGTVINFDVGGSSVAWATSLVSPDGERLDYHYKSDLYYTDDGNGGYTVLPVERLQSVTSNLGYQAKFTYQTNSAAWDMVGFTTLTSVKLINNSVEYCDPTADSCTLAQSWPTLAFSSTYLGGNRTDSVVDSLNQVTQYTFASNSQLIGVKRPGSSSNDTTIGYDANGRVSSVAIPGRTMNYSFSLAGTTLTGVISDSVGTVRTTTADTTKSVVLTDKDGLNRTTTYGVDSYGRTTLMNYPEGNWVHTLLDARGNITQTRHVSKTPGTPADVYTYAGYDASCTSPAKCNKPNWTKDAKGNQTDYTYNTSTGQLLTVTAPADPAGVRPKYTFTYVNRYAWVKNSGGTRVQASTSVSKLSTASACLTGATCAATANEQKTTLTYQTGSSAAVSNNLPISVNVKAGDNSVTATTAMAYDNVGNVISTDGPLSGTGDTTAYKYDAIRRQTGVIGPDPDGAGALPNAATRTTYDTKGRITVVEQGTTAGQSDAAFASFTPAAKTVTTYDDADRTLTQTLQNGSTAYAKTQYTYDARGRLDCAAQRMNPAIYGSLPASACTLGTAGSLGKDRITKHTYNVADEITQVQTAYGTAAVASETMAYTANGQVSYVVDANLNRTTYEYDGHDRPSKTRYPVTAKGANSSSTTDYEQFTYDAASNVTNVRLRDGNNVAMTYDNLNRLRTRTPTSETAVTFTYNLLGQPTLLDKGTTDVTSTYDALGRLTAETQPYGSASYAYDAAGNATRLTYSDGLYVAYDYDSAYRVSKVRENGATTGVGVLATYAYDNLGRRATVTYGNGTTRTYAYDSVNRMNGLQINLAGTTGDLTIGKVGTTGTALAYNPASQITSLAKSNDAYAYAGRYNVTRSYTTNGLNQYTVSGGVSLGYDARGNLTTSGASTYAYSKLNELTSGPGVTAMLYDGVGRLVSYAAGATTRFTYSGDTMIDERNTSNAILRRYVPGPGTDEIVVWYEGSSMATRRWLQTDERGSIIAITDDAGNIVALNSYDEFGIPASTNMGRFQYTGQTWFPELGMYNFKARIYAPTLGRFMQTDPIGYADGLNMYNYVGSDPVNNIDPSGTSVTCSNIGLNCIFTDSRSSNSGSSSVNVVGALYSIGKSIFKGVKSLFGGGNRKHKAPKVDTPQSGHFYDTTEKICNVPLSAGQRGQINRATALPDGTITPGRSAGTYPVGGFLFGIVPTIGGYVTTRFSADGNIAVNTTTSVHLFVGTIERTIYSNSGGTFIRTTGSGDAGSSAYGRARDGLNETMGPGIFREQNALSRIYASRLDPSC